MHTRKAIYRLIIFLALLGFGTPLYSVQPVYADEPLPPVPPEKAVKVDYSVGQPGIGPERIASSDSFGYTINSNLTPNWIDVTSSGTEIIFSNLDEGYSDPISVGFSFKYYI